MTPEAYRLAKIRPDCPDCPVEPEPVVERPRSLPPSKEVFHRGTESPLFTVTFGDIHKHKLLIVEDFFQAIGKSNGTSVGQLHSLLSGFLPPFRFHFRRDEIWLLAKLDFSYDEAIVQLDNFHPFTKWLGFSNDT